MTDPSFLSVLRLLATTPDLSQREVASSVGISLGKANFCLRALIAKGLVKADNYRKSGNKLAYLYLLTPSGFAAKAELTRRFLARKVEEYEALRVEIERLERESQLVTVGAAARVRPDDLAIPDSRRCLTQPGSPEVIA
jgi:EPS-associated MarR family transcriptional regulator